MRGFSRPTDPKDGGDRPPGRRRGHDFNNLLTVIAGNAELLNLDLGDDHECLEQVDQIKDTTDRAARRTQQLRAFSRKQVLQTSVLSLNSVVHDMKQMLRRLIGEAPKKSPLSL